METYDKFIEVTVPGTACNFKCDYCFISQLNETSMKDVAKFAYPPAHIGYALRKERIGGTAYINICGSGETLLADEMPDIIAEIVKQGHYVNVFTNGTLTKRFDEILERVPSELLGHMSFTFSLHYLELKRLGLLERYFKNFKKMGEAGCSTVSIMVLADSYLPHIDEIKAVSLEKLGVLPQVTFPKKGHQHGNWSSLSTDDNNTYRVGETFDSGAFRFAAKYYDYHRKGFCYAGKWSFYLNLATGWISKCYEHHPFQNIYADVDKPIKSTPVGTTCQASCCGGALFLPQGIVPELNCPDYVTLRDRPEANWFKEPMKSFVSQQIMGGGMSKTQRFIASTVNPIHERWLGLRMKLAAYKARLLH